MGQRIRQKTEYLDIPEGSTVTDLLDMLREKGWDPATASFGVDAWEQAFVSRTVDVVEQVYDKFGPGTQHVKRQQEITEKIRQNLLAMAEERTWD